MREQFVITVEPDHYVTVRRWLFHDGRKATDALVFCGFVPQQGTAAGDASWAMHEARLILAAIPPEYRHLYEYIS